MTKKLKRAPGPLLLSAAYRWYGYRADQAGFYLKLHREFGDIVQVPMGPRRRAYVVADPALVKHYLIDHAVNYTKNFFSGRRGIVMGEATSTAEGAVWKRHRRLVQPAYFRDWLNSMVPRMVDVVQRALDGRWEERAKKGEPFDMLREMSKLAISIMGQLVFSADPSDPLCDSIFNYYTFAIRRRGVSDLITNALPFKPGRALLVKRFPALLPSAHMIDDFARDVIAKRRANPDGHDDMVSRFMASRDEKGEGLNDLEARDELVDSWYGGHVSTTAGMAWAWYCLARHPEAIERVNAEVDQVLSGRNPTSADIPKLSYTTRVMEEALRLFPPAPGVSRTAVKEDQIAGYDVLPGMVVGASSFAMHKHPKYWHAPDAFDPDHFLPEKVQARPKLVYMPFGGGQRVCIGAQLAMMMSAIVLSMVHQRFRAVFAPNAKVDEVIGGVYHPQGLSMVLEKTRRVAPVPHPEQSAA